MIELLSGEIQFLSEGFFFLAMSKFSQRCEFNNKDEDNNPNIRGDKNDQASSEKFRQIREIIVFSS